MEDKRSGVALTCGIQQVGDNLEAVALVNEELLPLGAIIHFLRVLGDQGVKESIVLLSTLCTCMHNAASMNCICCFVHAFPHGMQASRTTSWLDWAGSQCALQPDLSLAVIL